MGAITILSKFNQRNEWAVGRLHEKGMCVGGRYAVLRTLQPVGGRGALEWGNLNLKYITMQSM